MNLSKAQKWIAFIISIFTMVGMIYTGATWFLNTIVTKDDLLLAVTDIRLGQIEESISRLHRIGLPNLTDSEKHRYDKLILAEQANDQLRKQLLGL